MSHLREKAVLQNEEPSREDVLGGSLSGTLEEQTGGECDKNRPVRSEGTGLGLDGTWRLLSELWLSLK